MRAAHIFIIKKIEKEQSTLKFKKNSVQYATVFFTFKERRETMKRLLLSSMFLAMALNATQSSDQEQHPVDPTTKYRNKKAHEAIIHDAYYEAEKFKDEIPVAWKEALKAFGYKEDDIEFYTAVRTNEFVERIGNKLVLLRPNFFLYCTQEEQKVYIAMQLASLQQDVEMDLGGSHGTFCNSTRDEITFRNATIGLTALGLIAFYHKQLLDASRTYGTTVKNVILSPAVGLVAGCLLINEARCLAEKHDKLEKFKEAQLTVVDKIGAEGLLSIREKQAHWSKNKSWWWKRKWYYLLGKLSLAHNSEVNLEQIQDYVAQKKKEVTH